MYLLTIEQLNFTTTVIHECYHVYVNNFFPHVLFRGVTLYAMVMHTLPFRDQVKLDDYDDFPLNDTLTQGTVEYIVFVVDLFHSTLYKNAIAKLN